MFVFTEQKKGNIVRSSGEEVMANLQSLLDVEESINVSSSYIMLYLPYFRG